MCECDRASPSPLLADELREILEFGGIEVGYGPIGHAAFGPMEDVEAVPLDRPRDAIRLVRGKDEEVDRVLGVMIDERRDRAMVDVIEPAADERKALCRGVVD